MKRKLIHFYRLARAAGLFQALRVFLTFGEEYQIKLPDIEHPIIIRRGTTDFETFVQIFSRKEYDFPQIRKPEWIVDAGANIGLFSVWAKNRWPEAKIIAVEPEVFNYSIMARNLEHYEGIKMLNGGLWGFAQNLAIYDKHGLGECGYVTEAREGGNIPGITLVGILNEYNIPKLDLLKIDIEGAEKEVFTAPNMANTIGRLDQIVIETHDHLLPGSFRAVSSAILVGWDGFNMHLNGENMLFQTTPYNY